jgi:hypothetical protein
MRTIRWRRSCRMRCGVVALPEAIYQHLATSTDPQDGKAWVLASYIPDGKADLLPSWLLEDDEDQS